MCATSVDAESHGISQAALRYPSRSDLKGLARSDSPFAPASLDGRPRDPFTERDIEPAMTAAVVLVPVLVLVLGILVDALSSNAKVAELGKIAYFVGLFWLVYLFIHTPIRL